MHGTGERSLLGAKTIFTCALVALGAACASNDTTVAPAADAGVADGPLPDAGGGGASGKPNTPGKYPLTLDVDGATREFIVYIPEKARGETLVPIVFMLHGTSGTGDEFFDKSQWREVADAQGFLAVFPSALTYCYTQDSNHDGTIAPDEFEVFTKWAAGQLGTDERPLCTAERLAKLMPEKRALADHPLRDDVMFFDAMLDHLGANYSVDMKRVYATGFSNGAEMTGRLANERSNRFAAIGLASSAMSVTPVPQANPITVIFTLGNMDEEQGPRVGGNPVPLTEQQIMQPAFASAYVAPMLTMLQLDKTYTFSSVTVGGKKTSQWLFAKSAVGASNTFRAVVIEDATHEYPNGTNHPIRLAAQLWEAFKPCALP